MANLSWTGYVDLAKDKTRTNFLASFPTFTEMVSHLYKQPIIDNEYDFYSSNFQNIKSKEELSYQKITKAETYFRQDVRKCVGQFTNSFYAKRATGLKYYHLSNLDKILELKQKGLCEKTAVTLPLLRKQVTGLLNQIGRANFTLRAIPLSNQTDSQTAACQAVVDWAYWKGNVKREIMKVALEALIC